MYKYQAKQSRDERREAARNRIKEKLAVLVKWKSEGVIQKGVKLLPKSKAEFCRWEDTELEETVLVDGKEKKVHGVFAFTEATLDKPHNSALKEDAVKLIGQLKTRRSRKGQNEEIKRLTAENTQLKIAMSNIINEFAASRIEFNKIENEAKKLKLDNDRLRERLRKVTPFPQGVD